MVSQEPCYETCNFGSGSDWRVGRYRAVIAWRRRHRGGATAKVGGVSRELDAGAPVGSDHGTDESGGDADGTGWCAVDCNQDVSTFSCAGNYRSVAPLRGAVAEWHRARCGAAG